MIIKISIKDKKKSDKLHLNSQQTYKAQIYKDKSKFDRNNIKKMTKNEVNKYKY